jgi:putative DNA primase/helicase
MSVNEAEAREGVIVAAAAGIDASAARIKSQATSNSLDWRSGGEAARSDLEALNTIPPTRPERVRSTEAIAQNVRSQVFYAEAYHNAEFTAPPDRVSPEVFRDVNRALEMQSQREATLQRPGLSDPDTRESIILDGIAARDARAGSRPPDQSAPQAVRAERLQNSVERADPVVERAAPEVVVLDAAARDRLAALRAADRAAATPAQGPANEGVNERFITALDQRLARSQLEERGWKGREDLDGVMRDLEKLAAVDAARASDLWSKYRPDDKDKPRFLDSDEFAADRARGASAKPRTTPEEVREYRSPEHIRKIFIETDDKFYYRNNENKLAFQDHGNRVATEHNDPTVTLSMVQIAEAKGWRTIQVRGSEEFRQEAWLQASVKGIEVKGYQPRDVDLAKLEEMRKELGTTQAPQPNSVERASSRVKAAEAVEAIDRSAVVVDEPRRTLSPQQQVVVDAVAQVWRQQGASERVVAVATATAVERFWNDESTNHQRVFVGKILARGEANFDNDPSKEKSAYVKISTPKGEEKIVWGADIPRALNAGKIKDGDDVVISNQGAVPVSVRVRDRDENGTVRGITTVQAVRNRWRVDTLDSLREDAVEKLKARAERADDAPQIKVYDRSAARTEQRPDVRVERTRDSERTR